MGSNPLALVTCSGRDTPGITARLTGILADADRRIVDIGQSVLHGWLSLSLLFEVEPNASNDPSPIPLLRKTAAELGLRIETTIWGRGDLAGGTAPKPRTNHYALTLMAATIPARTLHQVTRYLAEKSLHIDFIERLSEGGFGCVEMLVSSERQLDESLIKAELLAIARNEGVDIALQAEGLFRRAKRLIVFDMDSTLIQSEIIDEFARELGVYDEVARVTHEAMSGRIPFAEALRQRVARLRGLTQAQVDAVFARTKITPGAEELIGTLKELGYRVALISGGFTCIADRLKSRLGLHYAHANQLIFENGVCTGELLPPIVDARGKAELLERIARQEGIRLDQVIAVGDGANDIPMLEKAGLGIAFNAKPSVGERADLALNQQNLQAILYLLGIPGRDLPKTLA